MTNPFYTYSGNFIPGTLGRAEAVAAEYQAVQAGFALLVTEGVDTGAANAYVVTTQGAPTGIYQDGQIVSFKATNTPTGASTVNVNSIGAVPLLRFSGAATQSGDFAASQWITAIYNSTYGGFTITGPSAIATFAGTISNAAPTHKVGLVAAGGVSTSATPIDATYAIDQSIAPTWTGAHIFSSTVTCNGALTTNATVTANAPVTVNATASQVSLTVNGAANQYAIRVNGNSTSGQSFGLEIFAGTTSADIALVVSNQASSINFLQIFGDGHGQLGPSATLGLSWNTTGTVTVAAPSSGTSLLVNGLAAGGATGLDVNAQYMFLGTNSALSANGGQLRFRKDTGASAWAIGLAASAGTTSLFFYDLVNGREAMNIAAGGNVTVDAPSSGTALTVTPIASGTSILAGHLQVSDNGFASNDVSLFATSTNTFDFGTSASAASGWYTNNAQRINISSTGNVTINAPASGSTLTVNGSVLVNAGPVSIGGAGSGTGGNTRYITDGGTSRWLTGILGSIGATAFSVYDLVRTVEVLDINITGNWTIAAPSSGKGLIVNGASGDYAMQALGNSASGNSYGLSILAGTTSADAAIAVGNQANTATFLKIFGDGHGSLGPNTTNDLTWNTAGNFTIAAPTSGGHTVNVADASGLFISTANTSPYLRFGNSTDTNGFIVYTGATMNLQTANATRIGISSTGVTISAPASGNGLTVNGVSGTHSTKIADSATNLFNAGFLEVPQNSQAGNYTLVLADSGKHIYLTSSAHTVTIPANSSVAYPVGTAITIVNNGGGTNTIAITTDTLTWCPSGATGSRTIAADGVATLLKVTATLWFLTGVGIT